MKILYMGTPDFAAVILEKLLTTKHEIIGVVTQPDKEKGRGKNVSFSEVKEVALKHNLPLYQPMKVKDPEVLEEIEKLAPDMIIVAAFGQFLPKALLDIPKYGCINVHGSLLPKYRGAAPIQYAILDGEEKTGITIMYMDVKIDTGDMILKKELPIDRNDTGGSLFDKMAILGGEALVEAVEQIEQGTAARIPQKEEDATYVKMIDKKMGELDFTKPAVVLERYIRGLNPWPSAYTHFHGKTMKLWKANVIDKEYDGACGEIVEVTKSSFYIKTGEKTLEVLELQLEGKKRMDADAFLRGFPIELGTVLGE